MGPRADLDAIAKSKIFVPCQESNPSYPVHSLVVIMPALTHLLKNTGAKHGKLFINENTTKKINISFLPYSRQESR
jgi:hypothetical protein